MLKWFDKLIASRAGGFVLLTGLIVCVSVFVRGWQSPPTKPAAPQLAAIEHPRLEPLEPIARQHLESQRKRSEAIIFSDAAPASHKARAYGELGKAYLAYDFPGPAIVCLRDATIFEPDEFEWWYCLAEAHDQAAQVEPAMAALARARDAMSTDLRIKLGERVAALCFLGDLLSRANRPADGMRVLQEALQLQPNCLFALARQGQMAAQMGQEQKALELLQKAEALEPGNSGVRFLLAAVHRQRGDLDRAAQYSRGLDDGAGQRVFRDDPIRAAIDEINLSSVRQVRLGAVHSQAGRFAMALPFFVRALQADPDNVEAHTQCGLALLRLGRYEEARTQLEQALKHNEAVDKARWGLYMTYAAIPAYRDKAVTGALAWRKAHPESLAALQIVADVYAREQRHQDALNAYAEAARRDPSLPWPRLGQGVMSAAVGRHAEAGRILQEAVDAFPEQEQLRHTLARLLVTCPREQVRDGTRGLKLIQELCAKSRAPIRAETLAYAFAENGRFEEALQQQRWAIEHYRNDGGPDIAARLQTGLLALQSRKAWREEWPFCDTNGPRSPAGSRLNDG
jgi:tetratricopeptide (TPR) repeat protein